MQVCFRCGGLKQMYKRGAGYSREDMGGVKVDCPLCTGTGKIDDPEDIKKQINLLNRPKRKYTKKVEDEVTPIKGESNE